MTFRQNSNQQDSYLNYKRQCLELSNAEQDVHGMTEALANEVPEQYFRFLIKKRSMYIQKPRVNKTVRKDSILKNFALNMNENNAHCK